VVKGGVAVEVSTSADAVENASAVDVRRVDVAEYVDLQGAINAHDAEPLDERPVVRQRDRPEDDDIGIPVDVLVQPVLAGF
jgi:hypothetical protein